MGGTVFFWSCQGPHRLMTVEKASVDAAVGSDVLASRAIRTVSPFFMKLPGL